MGEHTFAALKSGGFIEFWGNDYPKCPHCGHVCNIEDMEAWHLYAEGDHELECPSCDGQFTVSVAAKYLFSTCDQDALDDEDQGHGNG